MIHNCKISRNTSVYNGGGIYCYYSNPMITSCLISRNNSGTQGRGGGIYCENSSPIINNCTISNNRAFGWGGGIFSENSNPTISNSNIIGNNAERDGGGIFGSGIIISRSVVYSNTADSSGGGYYSTGGIVSINNCTINRNFAYLNGGGILVSQSYNFSMINVILSDNIGNGGIYFNNSTNTTIIYNDFSNNQNGNLTGNIPQWLGQIVTVNNNGDSCDVYMNVFEDPLFYSTTGDSAFHLTENSPCIDAGDPASPLDPDSTIADMGAYYFHQLPIIVTFTPYNPPIQIPSGGGSFQYYASITNISSNPIAGLDAWTEAVLPDSTVYGPMKLRLNQFIPAGDSLVWDVVQYVPANAPSGNYTYIGYAGTYPDSAVISAEFPFEKLAGDDISNHNLGWALFIKESKLEKKSSVTEYNSLSPNPNPFNPSTALSYKLQAARNIRLAIYDIMGREVAILAEGFYPAGHHSMLFNAANLPSGVYFARLQAGDFTQTRKLLLVK